MKREFDGALVYHLVDVSEENALEAVVANLAAEKKRLDGLVAGTHETYSSHIQPCPGRNTD